MATIVKIKIRSKVCAEMYEKMRQLGRFTLRDEAQQLPLELSRQLKSFVLDFENFWFDLNFGVDAAKFVICKKDKI